MISDPVCQAVEGLHSADGMFYRNTGSCMRSIMFYLSRCKRWILILLRPPWPFMWQFYPSILAIFFGCPMKAQVKPNIDLIKPFQFGIKNLFHQCIIVNASSEETEQKEDLSV